MVATPEDVNLDYSIVNNMKKMKAYISMFDLSKLEKQQKLLMKAWKTREYKNSNVNDKGKEIIGIFKSSISSRKSKYSGNLI